MSVSPTPTLSDVEKYWQEHPAGEHEVAYLSEDQRRFFNERDRQTMSLYPTLDEDYGFARADGKLTLESGCGMGYNAQRLAQCGARLLVLDLALRAVRMTRERFALRGLHACFLVADAEHLPFENESLEMVFTSGVIHHSPDTQLAASEIVRVLRPEGMATVMIYHRNSIWFWWNISIVLGTLMWIIHHLPYALREIVLDLRPSWRDFVLPQGQKLRFADVIRAGTDFGGLRNPISRVFTKRQAQGLLEGLCDFQFVTGFNRFRAFQQAPSVLVRLGRWISAVIYTRWGWFLVVHARKL